MDRNHIQPHVLLVLAVAAAGVTLLALPPIPQDPAYHLFADQRPFLGIPNCLDVLSNLPFALVGLLGLAFVFRRGRENARAFRDPWERWPYAILFAGIALTTLGSAYYHLAPDN